MWKFGSCWAVENAPSTSVCLSVSITLYFLDISSIFFFSSLHEGKRREGGARIVEENCGCWVNSALTFLFLFTRCHSAICIWLHKLFFCSFFSGSWRELFQSPRRARGRGRGRGGRCFMARNMTNTHENSEFQDVWKEEGKCLSNSRQFAFLHFSFRSPRILLWTRPGAVPSLPHTRPLCPARKGPQVSGTSKKTEILCSWATLRVISFLSSHFSR